MDRLRHIYLLTGIIAMMLGAAACSTHKNTAGSRRYHAITARFNAMYNGQVAYDEGVDAQERGHIDNDDSPSYTVGQSPKCRRPAGFPSRSDSSR